MADTEVKISDLFENKPISPRFKTLRCELEAIASGKKIMSVFLVQNLTSRSNEMKSIHNISEELNLTVVYCHLQNQVLCDDLGESYVFVMRNPDSGRVATYLATRQILQDYEWSDGLEALESLLLGYNKDDIAQWMPMVKNRQLTWTGRNVYFLLNTEQLKATAALGFKCINPDFHKNGIILFFNRRNMYIKCDSDMILGKEICIGRCSLKQNSFAKIFGNPADWEDVDLPSSFVPYDKIIDLNIGFEIGIQIYRNGKWQ